MHRSPHCLSLFLLAAVFMVTAPAAHTQTYDATDLHRIADIADGTWLFHAGDDPQWARPDYDDSHWQPISTSSEVKDIAGRQLPRALWYRLHVRVSPTDRNLAISQYNVASAFEIYSNGVLLMRAGSVVPYR